MQDKELHDFLFNNVDDMKAENITTLDVRGKSSITDFMIVCTGTSKRHVSSIASNVSDKAKEVGLMPYGIDGEAEGEWVVVDMGNVMVHILQEEHRELYQLEKLWS
ncbi:ribosome silencing factor [Aliivibrio fischeri]|uniref:ribosome silencing factor n=1 Tax=Aliivibrio fischeri TaxID=668 RepID=UPI0007C4740E|nr:ribosome silencing factor [Aliivibrio fischeri]MBP3141305.1 ribosome silencing factor [Aliivibrio fischeri]MBP3155398.1 ribosome silencing factor [Aliivibrio fischeri]MCE7555547.1 ribosome silencing factor [Aliivibrio fischeri]MCE7563377.1 ribosome silencing factor [Aliivibrio fischeri]MCE7566894.1 ribosome silencing factor [Aliivibrio fischeri]